MPYLVLGYTDGTGSALASSLLMHFDGDFSDSSTNNFTVPSGSATIDTGDPKFGSGCFQGPSNQSAGVSSSEFLFGTGEFTIDCWIKTPNAVHKYIWDDGTVDFVLAIAHTNTSKLGLYVAGVGGHPDIVSTTTVTDGQWHHTAIVRSGDNILMFVDGNLEGTLALPAGHDLDTILSGNFVVGGYNAQWTGNIDELRVVKGTAIWTSSFTPPTAPYTA